MSSASLCCPELANETVLYFAQAKDELSVSFHSFLEAGCDSIEDIIGAILVGFSPALRAQAIIAK